MLEMLFALAPAFSDGMLALNSQMMLDFQRIVRPHLGKYYILFDETQMQIRDMGLLKC